MAGTVADGGLKLVNRESIRMAEAVGADEHAIRRLLISTPIKGAVSVSFEREPDYFKGTGIAGSEDSTLLAANGGRVVAMGACSLRTRFHNGEPRRAGYLGELRLDPSVRGRIGLLKEGFRHFRDHLAGAGAETVFTSIASDNRPAIRLLEHGLPGMPEYRFLTEFITYLISVPGSENKRIQIRNAALKRLSRSGLTSISGTPAALKGIVAFLNEHGSRHHFATAWTEASLASLHNHGLPIDRFQLILDRGRIVACAALWDQRGFRQTRIRGYGSALRWVRPLYNLGAAALDRPQLPDPGSILPMAFVSPLATADGCEYLAADLIRLLLPDAGASGIRLLSVGFSAHDPRLAVMRKNRAGRSYTTRLYEVSWADSIPRSPATDNRLCLPEVALL